MWCGLWGPRRQSLVACGRRVWTGGLDAVGGSRRAISVLPSSSCRRRGPTGVTVSSCVVWVCRASSCGVRLVVPCAGGRAGRQCAWVAATVAGDKVGRGRQRALITRDARMRGMWERTGGPAGMHTYVVRGERRRQWPAAGGSCAGRRAGEGGDVESATFPPTKRSRTQRTPPARDHNETAQTHEDNEREGRGREKDG